METKTVFLVLADISGYTRFIAHHTMSLLHAEVIVTELLETIIASTAPPLVLNKLEGDAVFFYAESADAADSVGQVITQQLLSCFDQFNARAQALRAASAGGCPCDACTKLDCLKLKAIIHYGDVVQKRIGSFDELASMDVILAHRLLKNSIGAKQYLLMSEACWGSCGDPAGLVAEERVEEPDGVGPLRVRVYYPNGGDRQIETLPDRSSLRLKGLTEAARKWVKLVRLRSTQPRRTFRNLPKKDKISGNESS